MPTKIQVFEEGICPDTFDDTQLPTDIHIVTFTKDGVRQFDAVSAYSKSDIFDEYYDKLGKDNPIHSIKSGYGRLNLFFMEKSKRKIDYINDLCEYHTRASKETYNQTTTYTYS